MDTPIGSNRTATTHKHNSGLVGDQRGVVRHVSPISDRDMIMDGSLNDDTGNAEWVVQGNDTDNLATHANHVLGRTSLSFDKVDGTANTVFAGFKKTDGLYDLSRFMERDLVEAVVYVSAVTNILKVHLRLGKDESNYDEWTWDVSELTAGGWTLLSMKVSAVTHAVTGTGWDPENVKYVAFLVEFDLESRALANIRVDSIRMRSTQGDLFSGDIAVDVAALEVLITATNTLLTDKSQMTQITNGTDEVEILNGATHEALKVALTNGTDIAGVIATILSLKSDLSSVAGVVTPVGDGVVDTGTQRITLASDDVLALRMTTALELIDHLTSANAGNLDANTQRVTLATDDLLSVALQTVLGAIGGAHGTGVVVTGGKAEATVPTEEADGERVALWVDTFGRLISAAYDLATGSQMVTDASPAQMQKAFTGDMTTLTAPGQESAVRSTRDYENITFSNVIAIGGNDTVDVIFWGSNDDQTSWFQMGDTQQYDASGTYAVTFSGVAVDDVKVEFDDEAGDTDATVTPQISRGN